MIPTESYNCYEYFKNNTAAFGDYDAAIHFGHRIKRSALLSDIDRLAAYFKSAGLRRGDVYTVFLPTCVQSFVAFYALNKIGVIANIVHPLTPPELLKETMDAVGSKGVMLMDLLAKPYVDMLNFHNVPCVVCSNSDYVSPAAHPAFRGYELFAAHASSGIKKCAELPRGDPSLPALGRSPQQRLGYCRLSSRRRNNGKEQDHKALFKGAQRARL